VHLRDALVESGKIAIATVVIRTRQHLAAVKPQKKGLMLELMHFPQELLDSGSEAEEGRLELFRQFLGCIRFLVEFISVGILQWLNRRTEYK
jgi:non-homologous end joining protein Ku